MSNARLPALPQDIQEWCWHLDLHLTEHDDRHRAMALKAAWPHISKWLQANVSPSVGGVPFTGASTPTSERTPSAPAGYRLVRADVLEWLHGAAAHPDDGVWFERPEGKGAYWWRSRLREATLPATHDVQPTDKRAPEEIARALEGHHDFVGDINLQALLLEAAAMIRGQSSATRASDFVVAGFFKKDMGRWIEVSDRQADEDGVEFLYMVASTDSAGHKP